MSIKAIVGFILLAAPAFGETAAACHTKQAGYRMTEMPAPKLMTGIGSSSLKITTKSPEAQAYFSQGLSLLHCFWDFEAYRAFKEAARLDPDAPMAYWGIIESINGYDAMADEKKAAAGKIVKLMDHASEHEKLYLRAQQENSDGKPYLHNFETILEKFPSDLDAQAFLGLSADHGYNHDGTPRPGQFGARSILENLIREHPGNAAGNHYLIHVVEAGPHPEYALSAADALAKLAPASGHMVHMPGHIYYKMGDQDRAREAFLASMKVDEEYMAREHVSVVDDWNYSHNISYLIASDAEAGRYKEALDMGAKLDRLPVITARALATPRFAVKEGSTTARLQIRFRNWEAVAKNPIVLGDAELAGEPARVYRDGLQAYAAGMVALEKKDLVVAARESDRLDALAWRLQSGKLDPKKDGNPASVLSLLGSYSLDLRGNLNCARGEFEKGITLLKQSADAQVNAGYNEPPAFSTPEQEAIAYAYLNAGQFEKARAAFDEELKIRPRTGHALYGIGLAYERAGDKEEARQAYVTFLEAWKNADPDLAMVKHARTLVN